MPLSPGVRLGPYEILDALGAGGMGEVYRARDTRLGRDVAIKVLPPELSANVDRKQRFEREARAISSLNHPNICGLHDVGSQDGLEFLVLEYVEGETLEKRLESGPLPTEVLLRHGLEIADALEKAHRTGIIHRDLKPANIMLTKSGAKLLDFGLAKWSAARASEEETLKTLSASATKLTEQGTLLGTIQYMAPEQLEGKEADARTDLFAFGEVLYEMATARSAFAGKTKASLIASILSAEPAPISALQPMTPLALDRLIRGCLTKDPEERWQTAHDVKLQLRAIAEGGSLSVLPASVSARRKTRERLAWSAVVLLTLLALVFAFGYFQRAPSETRVIRAYLKPTEKSSFVSAGTASGFALSPDGRRVAYVATTPEGKLLLWVRPLDSLQPQSLAGTEGAAFPFWSPDSRFIGFFAGGKLKTIEASGGTPLVLCDASSGRGGSWNREGVILFTPTVGSPLQRISAAGGTASPVTSVDTSKNAASHRWPHFLPDGRHFLYLAGNPLTPKESPTNAILVGSIDSKESKLLFYTHANAIYASGHILFLRQNALMAQPFDYKRLELTDEAFPIADPVQEDEGRFLGVFSASENGVLTYVEGASGSNRQLIWVDRSGKKLGEVAGTDTYDDPQISPDGKRLLFTLGSSAFDIWLNDIARGVKTRLTFGSSSSQANTSEVWSPDGLRIAYACMRPAKFGLCLRLSDGSGNEEVIYAANEQAKYPNDWSPDGRVLAYNEWKRGVSEIWMLPLSGERKPYPFLQAPFSQLGAEFSPDGKWLAYFSLESGRPEVYVAPFPGSGGKWLVSTEGGTWPRWRRDSKEIFYLSPDNKVMAAEVRANGSSFEVGAVRALFETRPYRTSGAAFDVSADGQRFIIKYAQEQPTAAITLVVNWTAELKKK